MSTFLKTAARIAFTTTLLCKVGSAQQMPTNPCATVENILVEAAAIKPGTSRADLEKRFAVSSFSTRIAATYNSMKCQYVAIDVEFQPPGSAEGPPQPTDKVVKISRPYLALPSKD